LASGKNNFGFAGLGVLGAEVKIKVKVKIKKSL
jgi:hypothetical protein